MRAYGFFSRASVVYFTLMVVAPHIAIPMALLAATYLSLAVDAACQAIAGRPSPAIGAVR